MKYIDSEKLIAEIERRKRFYERTCERLHQDDPEFSTSYAIASALKELRSFITSLQQEQPDVDLEQLKNKAELIANEIMMGVQANKYHTCIYNKASNDFNHSHLLRAALKGMELGLNARKK